MSAYLLIIFFNYEASVIEFHSQDACLEAKQEIKENVKEIKNVSMGCFKSLTGHGKTS